MTKTRNVKAELPYTFCERCPNVELEYSNFYSASREADMTIRYCIHQKICVKAVKMALDTIDKGDQLE